MSAALNSSASALDPSLVRALAGPGFRRADSLLDERATVDESPLERFIHDLPGWWPARRLAGADVARLDRAVLATAAQLRAQPDSAIRDRFVAELSRLKAAGRRAADSPALAAALACVGEASRRCLGLWPHPVQFSGARLLLAGRLAEMRTGEGKTLVAALAATLMAGAGARVHVVSTNDYLAERDRDTVAPLLAFFGLACGCVKAGMSPTERRAAYACGVCYVSGKELVFDGLKDRLAGHGLAPVAVARLQGLCNGANAPADANPDARPLIPAYHFAIIDEADSVLIDEARTPMILSRPAPGWHEPALLHWATAAAAKLSPGLHFRLVASRQIELLPGALAACPPLPAGVRAVWRSVPWRELLLRQALSARHLFLRDQHYILAEGKVQIVDESTGRVMADRSWEQGLHQLIEAKEGLELTEGRETLARITFQRFFRRYALLAGLTGTAAEASRELWAVYRLAVWRVPTQRPVQRQSQPSRCLPTAAAKWRVVADEAQALAAQGRPVLVGTRSVEASEQVAAEFSRRGIAHVVLNARQDAAEAAVVAAAGAAGRITVATNMAGRGTDIKPDPQARQAGGLHVILTEFHESPRVDRQLFGRCARQGQRGSVCAIVSAQDSLFAGLPRLARWALAASGSRALLALGRGWAQSASERRARQARMQTLRQDRELQRLIGFAGRVV